jgi:hypothetical protein
MNLDVNMSPLKSPPLLLTLNSPQGPLKQDSTDTNEYLYGQFQWSLLFLRPLKRGEKNWASFFGTHSYLYCSGSVVPAPHVIFGGTKSFVTPISGTYNTEGWEPLVYNCINDASIQYCFIFRMFSDLALSLLYQAERLK